MIGSRMLSFAVVVLAISLPSSAMFALASAPDSVGIEEAGVCTDLGCVGGNTKCAKGTITLPSGATADYTCYTTVPPGET
jgi:hypothetical protein